MKSMSVNPFVLTWTCSKAFNFYLMTWFPSAYFKYFLEHCNSQLYDLIQFQPYLSTHNNASALS